MLLIRRVVGESMSPTLPPSKLVFAVKKFYQLRTNDIVIVRHGGREKIKRIKKIKDDKVYLLGDNPSRSTDSRSFGWIDQENVVAKVLFCNKTL